MSKKPTPRREPKPDDPEQSKRFLETAEEVEADKDDKAFEQAFKRVAPARNRSPEKSREQI